MSEAFENILKTGILVIGWPMLISISVLITLRGKRFFEKLRNTVIGRLIIPTIFGWLYGMYMLGIVSTAYMGCLPWYYTVIPAFLTFMIAILIVYKAMGRWEAEATELQDFYANLEELVKKRTKELEDAHQKALKHEKELQKLKDQFVFIAAHELKTPVGAIKWGLEMAIEEGKKTLDPEILNYLQNVQDSNSRLITLVDDLLNVARIEAGTIKIEAESMDINKMIKETLDEMKGIFKEKNIEVIYNSSGEQIVYADKNRIKQVIINLLSNASKYNKEHGSITISLQDTGKFVQVSVSDTGIGIKEEDLEKLFKKFSRIEGKDTKDIEGTGLGLYLCKEIITKMGGEITAQSEYGKGSTFTFIVPKTKEDAKNTKKDQ